jgi:hypothetical protein
VLNVAAGSQWREHQWLSDSSKGPFVGFEEREGQYEFTRVHTIPDAVAHTADVLGLGNIATDADRAKLVLNVAGYAALLAGADAVRSTALRARLARMPATKPVLTRQLLQSELGKARSHPEGGWATAVAHRVSPVKKFADADQMDAGMAALQSAGLLRAVQRGAVFTDTGERLAEALNNPVRAAGITLEILQSGEWVKAAHASLFIAASDVLIVRWSEVPSADADIELIPSSAAGARDHIRELFEAQYSAPILRSRGPKELDADMEPRCTACGAPLKPRARFCTSCGAEALKTPAVERRCPNPQCGKVVAPDKKFCTSCGTRVPEER